MGTPGASHVGLKLILPGPYPWRVMLLGYPDAAMPQQHRDSLDGHTGQQQFDRKRVAESMGVAILDVLKVEKLSQTTLPISNCTLRLGFTSPEEVPGVGARCLFQSIDHELRQWTVHRHAGLGGV